jgi:hypothetical protein
MPIRISSAINGFRRAGVAHPSTPTVYPDGFFSAEQIKQLKAEPRLAVEFGDFETDAAETTDPTDPGADQAGAVEPGGVPGDLNALTVNDLRTLALDLGIEGGSGMKKADLIAAIQTADLSAATGDATEA